MKNISCIWHTVLWWAVHGFVITEKFMPSLSQFGEPSFPWSKPSRSSHWAISALWLLKAGSAYGKTPWAIEDLTFEKKPRSTGFVIFSKWVWVWNRFEMYSFSCGEWCVAFSTLKPYCWYVTQNSLTRRCHSLAFLFKRIKLSHMKWENMEDLNLKRAWDLSQHSFIRQEKEAVLVAYYPLASSAVPFTTSFWTCRALIEPISAPPERGRYVFQWFIDQETICTASSF